jgi:hypothetical protein
MNYVKICSFCLLIGLAALAGVSNAAGQGTAFTYQGRLNSGTNPANGNYDVTMALYNAGSAGSQVGSTVTTLDVGVTNGLFVITVDFGAVFNAADFWLQIGVRTNGSGSYTALTPRQELNPVPFSIVAETVSGSVTLGQLPSGVLTNYESAVTLNSATIEGILTLPLPSTIDAGGNNLLYANGNYDFFIGQSAGNPAVTGGHNTGVGNQALGVVTTGPYNTAEGDSALSANTSGGNNTAMGVYALWQNTNGNANTAVGADSLAYNISGSDNTATGLGTLEYNTSSDNTAVGALALNNNTTGFQNTGVGYYALNANTSGEYDTATGVSALDNNTTGSYNAAFGAGALTLGTTGSYNAAFGADALAFNSTGSNNTATGFGALVLNTTGNNNTASGYYAMGGSVSSSGGNTATGGYALYDITDGYNNTAAGYSALEDDSTGVDNVGIGVSTFEGNSTGSGNTAIGTYAFQNMSAGNGNVGVGMYAGYSLSEGTNNIYIGSFGGSTESGVIRIGTPGTQTVTYLTGTVNVPVLTITGGSDLAEPFKITSGSDEALEGSVMVIDKNNPGQLKLSSQAYDTHVAGVLSGANGVHPGIQMQQQGLLEGGRNVALTGRVYVQADTSNGAIEPGDLVTTSDIPGHAMKVSDHVRAQGAILGKAMTGLSEGKGTVLVLVTLQ